VKVLVVDNDRVSAISIRRLLEVQGHDASIAETGKEAWQRLRSEAFSVMIVFWKMPDVDGLELTRRVRAKAPSSVPHIILMTTTETLEDRREAFRHGADDFLSRPVGADELFVRMTVTERLLGLKSQIGMEVGEVGRLKAELERVTLMHGRTTEDVGRFCRDLELANAQLKAQSITDGLTGLKNHREFQERLADETHRAVRYRLPLSLMMLDVDRFKEYNDGYGHPAGDVVLRTLAKVLERHARETDVIARYGGEEFAVILGNTDRDQGIVAAERLRSAVTEEPWVHREITISIGVSTLRAEADSHSDLIGEADAALYASKSRGRNCVTHFASMTAPPPD
jgi:diguanylate cyclase (GGDEF)-like protein